MASKTSKKQHVRGAIKHFPESALFDARASAGQFMSGELCVVMWLPAKSISAMDLKSISDAAA